MLLAGPMKPEIPTGRTRETRIRRDAQGRWFNGDDPITHPNLVRAFDSWIDLAPDGRFCLSNDINWAYITLEGAPLFVRSITLTEGGVTLSLSDGRQEPLDPSTLRQGRGGTLYCQAREGKMAAQFEREAMQKLESVLGEDADGVYLGLDGSRVRPPVLEDPLEWVQE